MLTKEQIDNWRKVLGPAGQLLDNRLIECLRDKMQGRIHMLGLIDSGCELSKYFPELYDRTDGDPCIACGGRNECTIPLKSINHQKPRAKIQTETNAEIATRLGISKRQVAKRRKEGTL